MFYTILIALALITLVVWFINLSQDNKSIVANATANGIAVGATYSLSMGKSAVKTSVSLGKGAALYTENEAQDTLNSINSVNGDIAEAGGSIVYAATAAKSHRDTLGFTTLGDYANNFYTEQAKTAAEAKTPVHPAS